MGRVAKNKPSLITREEGACLQPVVMFKKSNSSPTVRVTLNIPYIYSIFACFSPPPPFFFRFYVFLFLLFRRAKEGGVEL